jgi:hypothetical protein
MLSRRVLAVGAVVLSTVAAALYAARHVETGDTFAPPRSALHDDERVVSADERLDALARAQVWRAPRRPVAEVYLGLPRDTPPDLSCRFVPTPLHGTTAKFDCDLAHERVRVKYGIGPEVPAEAAATRLLHVLGFGADEVRLVPRLRCAGCPVAPFAMGKVADATHTEPIYERTIDYAESRDFEWAAIERKFEGRPIETESGEGWAFFELDAIDPRKGGAPREHVDALRLLAVFLAHWDNKAENQRLVCLTERWPEGTRCREPFAMIQDLGATFGPDKVDLDGWEQAPIFADRATCEVSMRSLPYDGATFKNVRISDGGRRFLASLLEQLSDRQLADLFAGARFDQKRHPFTDVRPVDDWVRVFETKVRAISDGPPCPPS